MYMDKKYFFIVSKKKNWIFFLKFVFVNCGKFVFYVWRGLVSLCKVREVRFIVVNY